MSCRIIKTNQNMLPKVTDNWRPSKSGETLIGSVGLNPTSDVSESDIDAIANGMDSNLSQPANNNIAINGVKTCQMIIPDRESEINRMIDSYAKQNGSIVMNNNKIIKNQVIKG